MDLVRARARGNTVSTLIGELPLTFSLAAGEAMGMDLGHLTLVVKALVGGGQAEALGVRVGWRVTRVGGGAIAHLTQQVHDSTELSILQLINEACHLLTVALRLQAGEVADVLESWGKSQELCLESHLLELTPLSTSAAGR